MVGNVYLAGNTIRLHATFTNTVGEKIDPQLVKVIIYNYRYEKIEEFLIGTENRVGVGEYFFDYTTSMTEQKIIYEWYGEVEGSPAIERDIFTTVFVKE